MALVTVAGMLLLGIVGVTGPAQAKVPGPDGQIVFSRSFSQTTEDFGVFAVTRMGAI
jgi:hypothetical protein